jgi:hypothetical protein
MFLGLFKTAKWHTITINYNKNKKKSGARLEKTKKTKRVFKILLIAKKILR